MAGSFSDYLENRLLEWAFSSVGVTRPTAWYVALHSAAPGESGLLAELFGSGYARQSAAWSAPANGVISNTGLVVFGPALVDWVTISHFSVWTASSGGSCLTVGTFNKYHQVDATQKLSLAPGEIVITLD